MSRFAQFSKRHDENKKNPKTSKLSVALINLCGPMFNNTGQSLITRFDYSSYILSFF